MDILIRTVTSVPVTFDHHECIEQFSRFVSPIVSELFVGTSIIDFKYLDDLGIVLRSISDRL